MSDFSLAMNLLFGSVHLILMAMAIPRSSMHSIYYGKSLTNDCRNFLVRTRIQFKYLRIIKRRRWHVILDMACNLIRVSGQCLRIFSTETFQEITKGATSVYGIAPFRLFSFAYLAKRLRPSSRQRYSQRLLVSFG